MGEHCYTSVPCRRDRHSRCIKVCLYCGALCECECHLSFTELIDRSSLGTPGAKALRARTHPEVAEEIVRRLREQ